ncbi:MFS transporter [Acetobacterium tundrae]|uniref:DHA2 family efflux MFS transporter permease subunit n=1 Tax=Acetobacterium tundrae TaxID=132932 RepID=A0ABR6WNE3_9FIRM|nr:MFS transporter [Acetobacterium tundrae]MBC3797680.1 DHA2 family efflux MFS transporter permease subunit [Acetobacterium tundrae]
MKNENYKWIALSCTTMGALLSVLSGSTLIVALPDIMKELNAGMGILTWILMGYMLVLTILVPSIGRVADMFGRKKLYVGGFALFTIASLFCAWSNTGIQLLIFRLIQGVGGALLVANSTAIIADAFPKDELGKALGINLMFISVGSVIGTILGGFLVSIGWRSIFYMNLPVGIIGTLWAAFQLREVYSYTQKQKFDWPGTLTFTLGIFSLLMALTIGSFSGWFSLEVIAMFVIAVVAMIVFVLIENRTIQPMLDLQLFKARVLAFAFASNLFNGIARGAITFLMIFYFQGIKGDDPMTAGILLTPMALSMFLISPISGILSDKYDSRFLSSLGLIISAIGLFGLMWITDNTPTILLLIWMFIMGLGSGLFFSPNSNSIMSAVPPNKRGIASGVRTMFNNAGNVLSIAISMAIVASSVSPEAMQGLFFGTQVGSQGITVDSFIGGLRLAFGISFGFSILAAILSYMRGPAPKWKNTPCEKSA